MTFNNLREIVEKLEHAGRLIESAEELLCAHGVVLSLDDRHDLAMATAYLAGVTENLWDLKIVWEEPVPDGND